MTVAIATPLGAEVARAAARALALLLGRSLLEYGVGEVVSIAKSRRRGIGQARALVSRRGGRRRLLRALAVGKANARSSFASQPAFQSEIHLDHIEMM